MAANKKIILIITQPNEATTVTGNTTTTGQNAQIVASNEALLALAGAIRGPRLHARFEEAVKLFNHAWADKVDPETRRWAFNTWRNSEDECHLFLIMRNQERKAYFDERRAYFED